MPEEEKNIPTGDFNDTVVFDAPSIGIPWRVLVFSLILFGISLVVFLGLKFGYMEYLENRSEALDQSIGELADTVNQDEQQEFITFYSQLVNLKTVLDNHQFGVNALKFLEENTLPPIYFTGAVMNVPERTMQLEGQADTLDIFIEQLAVLKDASGLEGDAVVDNIEFSPTGEVAFSMRLTFTPTFFARL